MINIKVLQQTVERRNYLKSNILINWMEYEYTVPQECIHIHVLWS